MLESFDKITTKELVKNIDNKNVSIIDVRSADAYNGWRIKSEKRGGHIKGARSLPAKWTKYIDWIEIVRSKGIHPDQEIILYGYYSDNIEATLKMFVSAKYDKIKIYNSFVDEWSSNPDLPMEKLEKYNQLVYADWVKDLLDGKRPPEFDNKKFVVCHGHYQNRADYEKGHIPGAIALDTNTLESEKTWNRRNPQELKEALESYGISENTTVVLYGRFSFPSMGDPFPGSSAGHLGSIRAAFIMMYAGVKDVRILNGGIQSWEDAGYDITTDETPLPDPAIFKTTIPARPELAVDVPEAKEMIEAPDADIVCVRSYAEYIGEISGYHYIEKKGRIPGTVFGNCGTDAYHMENYRNLDHTTKEFHDIAKDWKEAGIVPEKHIAFYCGTGWRGSEAWLNAYLMGWPRVSVFDGGWFEWSNDPNNPTETGIPNL